jgi:hypothetical protein
MITDPPKLLSYYCNKVNIYTSDCFIPLPNYRTCPPPSMTFIYPGCSTTDFCGNTVPVPLPIAQREPYPYLPPGYGPCSTSGNSTPTTSACRTCK